MKRRLVMNKNHWNNDNDTNQNDCNEYTSSQTVTSSEFKTKKKANHIAMIVAATLLCAALCFGVGALGAMVDAMHDGDDTSWQNPSSEGGVMFDASRGSVGATISNDDDNAQRNPLHESENSAVRSVVDSGLTVYDVSNTLTAWKNFGAIRLGVYIVDSQYTEELQFGDFLLKINDTPIITGADVETALADCAEGDVVTIKVIRIQQENQNGRTKLVETTISVSLVLREYVPTDADVRFDTK
jgi:hypothetical protein